MTDEELVTMAVRAAGGDEVDIEINRQYPSPTGHAVVTGNGLRVRVQPHIDALQLGSLAEGDDVELWGSVSEWSFVRRGELCGWSATRYLERT